MLQGAPDSHTLIFVLQVQGDLMKKIDLVVILNLLLTIYLLSTVSALEKTVFEISDDVSALKNTSLFSNKPASTKSVINDTVIAIEKSKVIQPPPAPN